MKKCIYCGAELAEDDNFCYECGKPVSNNTGTLHDETSSNGDEVLVNENHDETECSYEEECNHDSHRKIFYVIGTVVVIGIVGACGWNYYSASKKAEEMVAYRDSVEKARQDSLAKAKQMEIARQDSILKTQQEEKEFIEKFYNEIDNIPWEKLQEYVLRYTTSNAVQDLKDNFDYDCPDGDCLALWTFTYEAGCDLDTLLSRKIERESENTFLITNIWGYREDSSHKTEYKVRLGVVKQDDLYKINSIVNVSEEERRNAYNEEVKQFSKYVGKWKLTRRTDEGRKMRIEVTLNENQSGELAVFAVHGSHDEVLVYEKYPQWKLIDGIIYLTKDGDITKGNVPKLKVSSDGLYSTDNEKYIRATE